jgi:hypothetical protein
MDTYAQPSDINLTIKILYLASVESLSYGQVVYFAGGLYSTGDYSSDTFYRQFHNIMTGETIRLLKETFINTTNITIMTRIVFSNDNVTG